MGIELRLNSNSSVEISAILFDLDGTLIDSLDLHIEAFQWILRKLGKEIGREELEPLMGLTPQDIIKQYFSELSKDELLALSGQKEDRLDTIVEDVYVYPGVIEFLKILRSNSVKTIVISSTHRRLVQVLLRHAGIYELIDDIVSGDEVREGKPHPEPFLTGAIKSGQQPANCLAIGDSLYDFHSATAGDIPFIGILTGKTKKAKFHAAGCKYTAKNIETLREIFLFFR